MSYEVDIRAVGNDSKSGDAIVLRYGEFSHRSRFRIVVIDGGFEDTGRGVCELIRGTYGSDTVDLAVSTHPDNDHAVGLRVVMENMAVGELWMHLPWEHSSDVQAVVQGSRRMSQLEEGLQKAVSTAIELEQLARRRGVPIRQPFAGETFGSEILVVGPSRDYYRTVLQELGDTRAATLRKVLMALESQLAGAIRKLREAWDSEQLATPEPNATSPTNNSSVILLANLGDTYLFTADAGVAALTDALPRVGTLQPSFVQLPHHGSKRNVSPDVMTRLLGPVMPQGMRSGRTAFISVAANAAPKHPSQRVINAARRRGVAVYATLGRDHRYASPDVPPRPDWGPLAELPFLDEYDD